MSTRTIVFADAHLRHRHLDTIRSWEEPVDKAIFLGDYWDQEPDTPAQNGDAALWVKEKLADPRNVLLLANHDLAYMFPLNGSATTNAYTHQKNSAIRQYLTQEDFEKLRLCHVESGILFTHAGISRDFLEMLEESGYETPESPLSAESIARWLDATWPTLVEQYSTFGYHPLFGVGYERHGSQPVGGVLWLDFSRFKPIPSIGQIVGHTKTLKGPLFRFSGSDGAPTWQLASKGVQPEWLTGGWGLDLDSCNHHYALIEDSILRVKSVNWERKSGDDHFTVTPGETICEVDLSN